MAISQLRRQIIAQLKTLTEDQLRAAGYFIEHLSENQKDSATAELLRIKGFRSSLRRAERQIAKGQTVSFAEARRDL
jgi:hypothetical protein